MEIMLTLNLWFVISLCLLSLVLGVMMGCWTVAACLSRSEDAHRW